ncbi:MAG: hypothetical protein R3C56_05025 [Pirellulaceae bacterium]
MVSLANEWASGEDDSSDEAEVAAEDSDTNHSRETVALTVDAPGTIKKSLADCT